jgi:calcineurin-like phosphoesterase family protein
MSEQVKFTNETLLTHYLHDLTLIDTTHNNKIKNKHPEYWNITSEFSKHKPLSIDPTGQHEGRDVWIWSDIHLGHKNIIKYAGRPYPNVYMMDLCLMGNYANVVKENDIVIWCGDITFGNISGVNETLRSIPGYKIHIIGNHDMDKRGKLNGLLFDEQYPCLVLDINDYDLEYQVLLTHYPLDIVPPNCINFHGHIHQHLLAPYNINVCVEHTNYTPMHMKPLLDRASNYIHSHQ